MDEQAIKFITIRRKGQQMIDQAMQNQDWKTIRITAAGAKKRSVQVLEQEITLKGYKDKNGKQKRIKQLVLKGNKIKPAFIIYNDFDLPKQQVVRKYAQI